MGEGPDPAVVAEHESGFALIETINDTNRFINKMEAQKLIDIAALGTAPSLVDS